MDFYQEGPILKNSYHADPLLKNYLARVLPPELFKKINTHLEHVGEQAVGPWLAWSEQAEREVPQHVPFNPWGMRIDELRMSEGWRNLEGAAAREGIVAKGYDRRMGEWARVYQAALLYLYHPSSAFVSCPLAMTDGAARALQLYGDERAKSTVLPHLLSTDPEQFWTSGQWMTERTGGSDVSGTSTIAKKENGEWRLYGTKWFTSATTSQIAMLLARPEGAPAGSAGLSLFMVQLRDEFDRLHGIEILRLKDKLGTKGLPTAELRLQGAPAELVGGEGGGVKKIASLFNITRMYNAVCSIGHWRRALQLAEDYANRRSAFGALLRDLPLHAAAMREQEEAFSKSFYFTMHVAHLLGRVETGVAEAGEDARLRALTPLLKLSTAKKCMRGVSEALEMFGGAGYCEDTGIPKLLRDAQVFPIWEGTTNVLSLDFVRALQKEQAQEPLLSWLRSRATTASDKETLTRVERMLVISSTLSVENAMEFRESLFNLADWIGELARRETLPHR